MLIVTGKMILTGSQNARPELCSHGQNGSQMTTRVFNVKYSTLIKFKKDTEQAVMDLGIGQGHPYPC